MCVDVGAGVEKIDAPHGVEDELAHDEPPGVVGTVVHRFGIVRPRAHAAFDVALFVRGRQHMLEGDREAALDSFC